MNFSFHSQQLQKQNERQEQHHVDGLFGDKYEGDVNILIVHTKKETVQHVRPQKSQIFSECCAVIQNK